MIGRIEILAAFRFRRGDGMDRIDGVKKRQMNTRRVFFWHEHKVYCYMQKKRYTYI